MVLSTFRLSKWYRQLSVYRNGIVNFLFIEMVSSTFRLSYLISNLFKVDRSIMVESITYRQYNHTTK